MSENLIESVSPLLAPPVTRRPSGLTRTCSGVDADGADVALLFIAYEDGADAAFIFIAYEDGE